MHMRHVQNPLKVAIEIQLLKFRDCLRHVDRSERTGDISEEDAHRLRNGLASVYAREIVGLVERGSENDG